LIKELFITWDWNIGRTYDLWDKDHPNGERRLEIPMDIYVTEGIGWTKEDDIPVKIADMLAEENPKRLILS
jgi:hypothetical protein